MKFKRQISILLAFVLTLGCFGFSPASAQQAQTDAVTNSSPSPVQTDDLTKDSQILDHVDAEQFQNAGHIARLPGEETLDSYVFLNGDGTKSVYYMGRPVKYVDENGTIREKDTTLVRRNGGYGMRDNDVALHIPDTAANGITLTYNNCTVKLTPQGGSGVAQQEDNSIVYANYFGRGTFLRYTPMLSGMKEDIILAKYTGQNSFTFLLETGGLRLYETEGSYYLAENEDAEAAFHLGQILVYDAIGRPDLGTMTAETLVPGQRYRLTVSADEAFLTDPQTVYPVTIDPTLTVRDAQSEDHTLEDAPVFSGYPNWHCGDYVYNSMGYVEGMGTAMTAIRLTGLLADSNYSQLTEAQLNNVTFYIRSAGSEYANISVHALTENSTWTEMGLTWNNIGAYSETSYASQDMGNVFWAAFDITNLAKDWKNGTQNPQCGFVLVSDSTTRRTATYAAEYGTADNRPYVVVNYNNQLTVTPSSDTMYVGESMPLTAISNPAGQAVTWESDAPTVASVDENGVVTGLSAGTATITATLADGTFASCEIEVLAKSISLNYNTSDNPAIVYKGDTVSIEVTTQPANEEVEWESLSPEIATVSNEGEVTGVSPGRAIIRAILNDDAEATCVVIVTDWEIWLDEENLVLAVGESYDIDADTIPPGLPYNWSTGDADVAVVDDDGLITAMGVGQTYITAMLTDGQTVGCFVEVVEKQIVIEAENNDVDEGSTLNLTARTTPENRAVSWNSSNTAIATVDQNGLITGIEAGVATITASMDNGPSATYTVYVTVADGVYHMALSSNLYLQAEQLKNKSFNGTAIHQKIGEDEPITSQIAQMWRITYIGEGRYTIRPLNNLSMCLYIYDAPNEIFEHVVNYYEKIDSLDDVPARAQWTITWTDAGYVFMACADSDRALTPYRGYQAEYVSVVVDVYSDTSPSFHWILTKINSAPVGVALYNSETGLPVDSAPCVYVAPKERKSLVQYPYDLIVYPEQQLEQELIYEMTYPDLVSCDNNGYITGIARGSTGLGVRVRHGNILNCAVFQLVVTEIPNGIYFLENKATGCYADIHSQIMENGRTIHQWEFHGGDTQQWKVTHLGDGTYSILSENSSIKHYLGVSGDASANNQPIVLRTGSITDGMKWKIERTNNGSYKIISQTDESTEHVLATSTTNASNGAILVQTDYTNDNNHRDEWQLYCKRGSVDLRVVFDNAYVSRLPDAENVIQMQIIKLQEKFLAEFGVLVQLVQLRNYVSCADICSTDPTELCNHDEFDHKNVDNIFLNLASFDASSALIVAFIGHQMCEETLSTTSETHIKASFDGIALPGDGMAVIGWLASDSYRLFVFIHEFGHLLGAPDHYSSGCPSTEDMNNETGTDLFVDECIYGERASSAINQNYKICDGCKEEIIKHIIDIND